jgi:hypothetical protein
MSWAALRQMRMLRFRAVPPPPPRHCWRQCGRLPMPTAGQHYRGLATSTAEGLTVGQLYDGLQLPRGASKAAVKARYFKLAKTLHPDSPDGSNEKFGRATDIYQRLLRIAPVRVSTDAVVITSTACAAAATAAAATAAAIPGGAGCCQQLCH